MLTCMTTIFSMYVYGMANGAMVGRIVNGIQAQIEDFPHSAYLLLLCKIRLDMSEPTPTCCGSSIVNQRVLLTAAHCLDECGRDSSIIARVGSANKKQGITKRAIKFIQHEDWDKVKFFNDIAIVLLKEDLVLGNTIKRVILMKDPPKDRPIKISGWGRLHSDLPEKPDIMMVATQKLLSRETCIEAVEYLPPKTFCGNHTAHFAKGDSGGALMVQYYYQIGIVSFRCPRHSDTIGVYTDVPQFIDWLQVAVKKLYCSDQPANL